MTGLETCHQFVDIEWIRHSDEVPYGDSSVCSRVNTAGGLYVLCRPERSVLSDSCLSGISAFSPLLSRETALSVSSCPRPCRCLLESLLWFQRAVRLLRYLNDWLVVAKSRNLMVQHWELFLQLCEDLGIIVNWEKSDLQLSTRVQYLGMLISTSLQSPPVTSSSCLVSGGSDVIPSASFTLCMDVAAVCWAAWRRWNACFPGVAPACVPSGGNSRTIGLP